jgi:catechol 2,3-dioxygenase-like lactoylglutathione lyase family enzyme
VQACGSGIPAGSVRSSIQRSADSNSSGLTHIALAVRDPQRSLRFYQAVLGVVPVYQQDDYIQVQTPGSWMRHLDRALEQVGLRLEHVRLLVCTHAHIDHCGQAAAIHRAR